MSRYHTAGSGQRHRIRRSDWPVRGGILLRLPGRRQGHCDDEAQRRRAVHLGVGLRVLQRGGGSEGQHAQAWHDHLAVPEGMLRLHASSLSCHSQVIYAPVGNHVFHAVFFFDSQCRCDPYSKYVLGRYFSPVFCHPKYTVRPRCLLHAILSCSVIEVYQIIPAIKWSYKNRKIWIHLTWGYIAKRPYTGNYNRITDKGPLKR